MQQTRREFLGTLAVTSLLGSAAPIASAADVSASAKLTVMTYNLRYANATGPNAWPKGRPLMKALIDTVAPDLIGTQEGVYPQIRDFAADQPAFDWIGLGRDGGSRGEFMAVFYRRERLEPLEFDHFWLSDTPETIGSTSWGNTNRRMVTWVRFRDRRSDREFYAWNTHFDHEVPIAREKIALLVRERLAKLPPGVPVLLVGDFNAAGGSSKPYELLLEGAGLEDTWKLAHERRNADFDSFNGFESPKHRGERIDWILGRGLVSVGSTEIVTGEGRPPFPSDHFPLVARVSLK